MLKQLPGLLRDSYGAGLRVWVLSDGNTERAAGARCKELMSCFRWQETVLPANPKPRPTLELAQELTREAGDGSPDLVLAVGAGTISDLGKKVSHELGLPNWCVATAPSVDAYGSGHSVFKSKDRHQSIPSAPSERIFCELPVLEAAPRQLRLSGLGDLLGKFLAYLDWTLSSLLTGEYICPESARFSLESARRTLDALRMAESGRVVSALTDALLTTGFLMQALGSSRPASSAEHTVAHVWELAGVVGNTALNLHGMLVGLASRIVLEAYQVFYELLPRLTLYIPSRLSALSAEPSWEELLEPAMLSFSNHIRQEMSGMVRTREVLESRLKAFEVNRERIGRLAAEGLGQLEQGITALQNIGYPFTPEPYQIECSSAFLPFPYIHLLRNRYSTFSLMHELGKDAEVLEALKRFIQSLS